MATSAQTPSTSTTHSPLKLAVRTGEHAGKELLVSATSCTLGSHPDCTVRFRGDGFDPVHCWIMRGKHTWLVRQMSANTKLNGKEFTEARIHRGDRLSIAGVTLEVADTAPPNPNEATIPLAQFQNSLNAWDQEKNSLLKQHEETHRSLKALEREYKSLKVAHCDLSLRTESLQKNIEVIQSNYDAAVKKRRALEQQIEESQLSQQKATLVADENKRLTARVAELTSEIEQNIVEKKDAIELSLQHAESTESLAAEIRNLKEQIRLHEDDARSQSSDLQAKVDARQQEVQKWKTQAEIAAEETNKLKQRFSQATAEHAAELSRLSELPQEGDAGKYDAEIKQLKQETERLSAELVNRDAELASSRTFMKEHAELSRQLECLNAEKQAAFERAEHAEQLLNATRQEGERLQQQLTERLRKSSEENEISGQEMPSPETEVKSSPVPAEKDVAEDWTRAAFAKFRQGENRNSEQEERTTEEPVEESSIEPTAEQLGRSEEVIPEYEAPAPETATPATASILDSTINDGELTEETPDEKERSVVTSVPVDDAPPTSAADILAKFGIQAEPEDAEDLAEEHQHVSHSAQISAEPNSLASGAIAALTGLTSNEENKKHVEELAQEHNAESGEDDSIESYMAALLARSRGEAAPPSLIVPQKKYAQQSEPEPRVFAEVKAVEPKKEAQPTLKAEEYRPRSQAPEQANKLAAMRELANESARSAIDVSIKKRWRTKSITSLAIGIGGFVASGTAFYTAPEILSLSSFLGAVACVAGGFFVHKSVQLYRCYQRAISQVESWRKQNNLEPDA
jgi:outer membrane murein-binding lipoprotein Lpp